ncbi:hypothetical protein [Streptomyces tauricus]
MSAKSRKPEPFKPGTVPAPGELLVWKHPHHFDRWQDRPCALCKQPTPMRSHHDEPVHKVCAEAWITANPVKARQSGRFASDAQPKRSRTQA